MSKPTRKKLALVLIILAVLPLLVGGYLVWHWANQPVNSAVISAPEQATVISKPLEVKTTYYRFTVPAGFRVRTATDSVNASITHTQVIEPDSMGREAGVTSNLLPAGGLPEVADYNLRAKLTDRYQPLVLEDMPAGSIAFRDTTSGERTIFLVNGERYASISVSGVSGNGRMRNFFSQIYTTWRWL